MRANDALVSLSFGAIESQERPVGLWIAAAFVLGGFLGLMVGLRLFFEFDWAARNCAS